MYIIFHYKKSTHIWISPNASRLCSISIIIFLFSFQALRQTRQQCRHLRISQNLHQKFRIHTFRNSHRVCCLSSICTLHLRIKIFPVIKRILHSLCILSPVFVNDMAIYLCHHVRLCMSGIALDRFDVSTTKLQLVCDTCMPLRYNYDKPEKPRRIKGFEVFSLVFSSFSKPKNHTEISRIIGGVSLTTNE